MSFANTRPVVKRVPLLAAVFAAQVAVAHWGRAQIAVAVSTTDGEAATNKLPGFSVRRENQQVTEAVEDFERFRSKEMWDKAFAGLNKVFDADPSGLSLKSDGFYVTTPARVQDELLTLPASGREAFRLFYDPKAEQLLRQTTGSGDALSAAGPTAAHADDIENLSKIVNRYFVTSVGDRAADRLGDALFEAGDFAAAERSWRLILDNSPGTTLSPALLQTKRGIALARLGAADGVAQVRGILQDRFSGQTVRIGGRDVIATEYLDALTKDLSGAPASHPEGMISSTIGAGVSVLATLQLPSSDAPAWQIPLMDDAGRQQINDAFSRFGWQMLATQLTAAVPPIATDGKRVYANWFGACFAADLNTGKMLWRTQTFAGVAEKLSQAAMRGEGATTEQGAIRLVGNQVLFTGRPSSGQDNLNRLTCLESETGKVAWTSGGAGPLSKWSVIGQPLVEGDSIYVCAHPAQSQDVTLLSIGLKDGDLRWEVLLGTPALGTDFRGMAIGASPVMLRHDALIYILTNNGVLLAINPAAHRIEWAFSYPTQVTGQQQFFGNQESPPPTPPGAMFVLGSTLLFKETGGDEMYAIDLSGPVLKWKRPIEPSVTLVAADEKSLYLVGAEADCIDADSHALRWSDKLSVGTRDVIPLVGGSHLYVFGERGIHDIQTADGTAGPIFRGYDRDGAGGTLWQTGDRVITVSSSAITAYPLGAAGRH
jgi:outer membrane protein assembly factor BamB